MANPIIGGMNEEEIKTFLLKRGIEAVRRQAGYIADCTPLYIRKHPLLGKWIAVEHIAVECPRCHKKTIEQWNVTNQALSCDSETCDYRDNENDDDFLGLVIEFTSNGKVYFSVVDIDDPNARFKHRNGNGA